MTATPLDQARENYRALQHAYDLCRGRKKLSRRDVHTIVDVGKRAEQLLADIGKAVRGADGHEAYLSLLDKSELTPEKRHGVDPVTGCYTEELVSSGRYLESDTSVQNNILMMAEVIRDSASLLGRVPDLDRKLGETDIARTNVYRGTAPRGR